MADSQEADDKLPEGAKRVPSKAKSNKGIFVIIGIVLFLLALPGLAVIGFVSWISQGDNAANLAESAIERSLDVENVEIDTKNAVVNIESKDGDSLSYDGSSSQEPPEDLPSDVVLHGNQAIISSFSIAEGATSGWNIVANTEDSLQDVQDYLEAGYGDSGWQQTSTASQQDSVSYSYQKGAISVEIYISDLQENRRINYIVSKKE